MDASGSCRCGFKKVGATLGCSGVITTLRCDGFGITLESGVNPGDGDIIGGHTRIVCSVKIIASCLRIMKLV